MLWPFGLCFLPDTVLPPLHAATALCRRQADRPAARAAGRRRRGQPAADLAGAARARLRTSPRPPAASARWPCWPSWMPDIIVLDAQMPGLDGFDTCRRLRALPGLRAGAGADADRARRRRLDRTRLPGRRHRLLRQGHAVEPAGRAPALPAAQLAHAHRARAQQGHAGARAGPGPHGQLRLARGASIGLWMQPEALRVFGLPPAERVEPAPPAAHGARRRAPGLPARAARAAAAAARCWRRTSRSSSSTAASA